MSRLRTIGVESGASTVAGGATTGEMYVTGTVETTGARTGTRCVLLDASGEIGRVYASGDSVLGRRYYLRSYIKWNTFPTSQHILILLNPNVIQARVTAAGKLQLWAGSTFAQVGSDSAATLTTGVWYRIELSWIIASGAGDAAELLLDGTSIASTTGQSWSDSTWVNVDWSVGASGAAIVVDDIALNDDQGSDQNSWPGAGAVRLLVPTSDSARATLWTGGAGGTTNLYDAVNNTPPIGTATETDLTQIEHAGGAAGSTDAYDANMTTYDAAGVPSADTITVIQGFIEHGEDVGAGTKNLSFENVSNPAISSTGSFAAGDDAGALGTWPTAWRRKWGPAVYTPSVTRGTAPVMRVIRPETATRVASVCAMGLCVESAPASKAPPPFHRATHVWRRRVQ